MNTKLQQKMIILAVLGTITTFGSISIVHADDYTAKRKMDMQALDTDKDGYLSRSEGDLDSTIKDKFEAFDTNLDGKIDEAEFMAITDSAPRKTMPVFERETFDQLDSDKNGVLTKEELSVNVEMSEYFDQMDSNKDGSVDSAESDEYEARRKQSVES